jgi:SPP1 family predicted phage head-tail adaptor
MPRPAGRYREVFVLERPVRSRNAAGGTVETWETVATILGSYEQTSYSQQARNGQINSGLTATVYTRYRAGVAGDMRLRWPARGGRLLYISSVVETGNRDDLELTVEEQAA